MKIVNRLYLLVLALSLFSAPALAALSGIETEAAQLKEVPTTYLLEAVVEATQKSTISAQTSGVVKEVYFDVNDFVRKGELVVLIDDTQQQADLRQARAALNEARARLQEARLEYDRVLEVYKRKVVPKSSLDKASAALKSAQARVQSAEAAVAKAREQLGYTRVRAPYSGILVERHVEPGEAVGVGAPLVAGISLEKLRVVTHVPQSLIRDVRNHKRAIVVTDDSEIVSDKMTFFPFADTRSHSFVLRVELPEGDHDLLPGMFVKVAMEVGRSDEVVIPFSAVAFRGEVTGIYVLQDQKLHFRHIRLGRRLADNEVVVISGLQAGELVVTDPVAAAIIIKQEQAEE